MIELWADVEGKYADPGVFEMGGDGLHDLSDARTGRGAGAGRS